MTDLHDTLTAADLADRLKVAPDTVRVWCRRGRRINGTLVRLPAVVAGGYRIRPEDAEQFVKDCTAARVGNAVAPTPAAIRRTLAAGKAAGRAALNGGMA